MAQIADAGLNQNPVGVMSYLAFSSTFPIEPSAADAAVAALLDGDIGPVDEAMETASAFSTGSRNHWLENQVLHLIRLFDPVGLDYLSSLFRDVDGRPVTRHAVTLHGDALDVAIGGLLSLIANPERGFAETISALEDADIQDVDIQLMQRDPAAIADVVQQYEAYCMSNEGDDTRCLITFLQGQLCVLRHAKAHSLAAVYTVSSD
jgi:hypothetical protein